jgi:hypothetical protein
VPPIDANVARTRWLLVVLGVLCLSLAGSVATYAAFTAQTSNGGSSFSAGSWPSPITYGGTGPAATRTSSGNLTVSYPAATSASDGLLLVEVNAANQAITTPSGWGLLADQATGSPSGMRFTVWGKLAGNESSVDLDVHTNSSGAAAWVVRYYAPDGYPPNLRLATATIGDGQAGATATLTPTPDVTTNADFATAVSIVAVRDANALALSSAQTFSVRDTQQASPGAGVAFGVADAFVSRSGSTPASPTWSQSGTPAQWAWVTFAVSQ